MTTTPPQGPQHQTPQHQTPQDQTSLLGRGSLGRKLAIAAAVLVALLGLLAATFTPAWFLTPSEPFDAAAVPPAPDYTLDAAWAALPGVDDHADLSLPGVDEPDAEPIADVFFVHPTTYFSAEAWNAAIDDPMASELLDEVVLASEASAFGGCCRVFAPRYRQATLGTFYADRASASAAFGLAYRDVAAAFAAFLGRIGDRPFVLAGHSQGSMHLMRLLERVQGDEALRGRLVAAYLPGYAIPTSWYAERWPHLRPCDGPEAFGCVAAWDTYREGATVGGTKPLVYWRGEELATVPTDTPRQCTNPVSWRDGGSAEAGAHRGAVSPHHVGATPGFLGLLMASEPLGLRVDGLKPHPDLHVAAHCEDGVLRVPDLGPLGFPVQETEPGNYHLHDVELFQANVRANARARVNAFAAAR